MSSILLTTLTSRHGPAEDGPSVFHHAYQNRVHWPISPTIFGLQTFPTLWLLSYEPICAYGIMSAWACDNDRNRDHIQLVVNWCDRHTKERRSLWDSKHTVAVHLRCVPSSRTIWLYTIYQPLRDPARSRRQPDVTRYLAIFWNTWVSVIPEQHQRDHCWFSMYSSWKHLYN